MYKSIRQYDRLNRRKLRQARELHKKLLVCFAFLVFAVILGLKVGEILTVNYCEDRPVGEVTYEQLLEHCIPGDGLSHKEYTGVIRNYAGLDKPIDIQNTSNPQ